MTTTATKARPIIFSAAMVRAILDGRKTQTRRVIPDNWWRCFDPEDPDDRASALPQCPYGAPGDLLWVRETFADLRGKGFGAPFAYLADTTRPDGREDADSKRCRTAFGVRWSPSIHMLREASRITLRVTDVRVQRVQEITPHEALAEGVVYQHCDECPPDFRAVSGFRDLWNSINAARGFGWDANPWVWAVTFEVAEARR